MEAQATGNQPQVRYNKVTIYCLINVISLWINIIIYSFYLKDLMAQQLHHLHSDSRQTNQASQSHKVCAWV